MYIFFKKMKHRSLSKKNASEFYKFAVGEVVLVMLGILLALQVDNWNEKRKENQQELILLTNLHEEFGSNLQTAQRVRNNKQDVLSAGELILGQTGENSSWNISSRFDSLLAITLVSGFKFFPEDAVMTDLLNSGKVSLIRNDSLRYLITSLAHDINLIQDEDAIYRSELHAYILPYVGKRYPTRNIIPEMDYRNLAYSAGASHFESLSSSLLNQPEFESILTTQHIWFTISVRYYDILIDKYRAILNLIQKEISG
jgi:hypothetical protein